MIFDRISLVDALGALEITDANEGRLSQILFNRTAHYGTKTIIRFSSVKELKAFIEREYAYQAFDPNCECATCNESIWQLLSFTVKLPGNRSLTFVNNMRGEFESGEGSRLNKTSRDALSAVFVKNQSLIRLKKKAYCYGYIENQGKYVSPCDYIELIKSVEHDALIKLYTKTQGKFGLNRTEVYVDRCNDGVIERPHKWPSLEDEFPCSNFEISATGVTDISAPEVTTTTTIATVSPTTTAVPINPGPSY